MQEGKFAHLGGTYVFDYRYFVACKQNDKLALTREQKTYICLSRKSGKSE